MKLSDERPADELTADNALDALTKAVSTDWRVPPVGPDVDDRWQQAFVATKFADALAQLLFNLRLNAPGLDVADRVELKQRADAFVQDTIDYFERIDS